ncbi:unnamed protein product [Calypogeia fissa]
MAGGKWKNKPKPKAPEPPSEVEIATFPMAIQKVHWNRHSNPPMLKTPKMRYLCLLMTNVECSHFTKKSSFVKHMITFHHMRPTDPPLGRPKTSTRTRNPSVEAIAHNRELSNLCLEGKTT